MYEYTVGCHGVDVNDDGVGCDEGDVNCDADIDYTHTRWYIDGSYGEVCEYGDDVECDDAGDADTVTEDDTSAMYGDTDVYCGYTGAVECGDSYVDGYVDDCYDENIVYMYDCDCYAGGVVGDCVATCFVVRHVNHYVHHRHHNNQLHQHL